MAHWKYLPIIATINNGLLLNKKMLLSNIAVLRQNFLNIRSRWVKFINVTVVTQNWTNTRQNFMCLQWPYYPHFWSQKIGPLHLSGFSQNSPNCVACCTFDRFKISTLTPSRFKNETNDALKLLGRDDNH